MAGKHKGVKVAEVTNLALSSIQSLASTEVETIESKIRGVTGKLGQIKPAILLAGMQWLYLRTWAQVGSDIDRGVRIDPGDLRNYATTMAICVDKVQLLSGQPTEILEVGQYRDILPNLAERLANAGAKVALAISVPAPVGRIPDIPLGHSGTPPAWVGVGTGPLAVEPKTNAVIPSNHVDNNGN